jgi:hypothetical protein
LAILAVEKVPAPKAKVTGHAVQRSAPSSKLTGLVKIAVAGGSDIACPIGVTLLVEVQGLQGWRADVVGRQIGHDTASMAGMRRRSCAAARGGPVCLGPLTQGDGTPAATCTWQRGMVVLGWS